MKAYLSEFLLMFDYPQEACEVLGETYEKIYSRYELRDTFEQVLKKYDQDMYCDFGELTALMERVSEGACVHVYTGYLFLFICLSRTLKRYYNKAKMEEEIWFTSMCDLKWKMLECKNVHGIWGTFVPNWFRLFYCMQRFGFGKLQFNPVSFGYEYEKDGVVLRANSQVITVHIPRTGTKLDRKSMKASYRQAAEFFQHMFPNGQVIFVCHSWLLFPRNKELLSKQSNLYAFISDYEVVDWAEYNDYSQVWRLFDMYYNGDADKLPQDTSLRRAYAGWIRKGIKTGWGYGVYLYKKHET